MNLLVCINNVIITVYNNYYRIIVMMLSLSSVTASILPDKCSQLSHTLNSISSVTVGVVNIQYKGHVIPEQYREVL